MLQQISLGGASSPAVTPVDATSQAAQGQTSSTTSLTNNGGLTMQQYLSDIANTPFPVVPTGLGTPQNYTPSSSSGAVVPLTGALNPPTNFGTNNSAPPASPDIQIDPFTGTDTSPQATGFTGNWPGAILPAPPENGLPGNPYAWDPFSFAGAGEGAALNSETQSPGYQAYGKNWLDLLNTISSQDLQWGGTNQFSGELKGGGSVGPWLTQNILTPWNSGNQQDAYANATYFISSQTGKPVTDPEVQQLGGAFLEYTLQNANRYGANTQNFDQRKASEGGKGILGPIESAVEAIASIVQPELAPAFAAINFAQDAAQGDWTGAGLSALGGLGGELGVLTDFQPGVLGDIGNNPELLNTLGFTDTAANIGPSLASDASTISDLSTIGQVANAAGEAGQVGQAVSQGNYIGALGPGVSLGSGLASAIPNSASSAPSSIQGTNAASSGGVLSSLADSLGLTPEQLASYGSGAIALGGSAVPLIQSATAGQTTLSPNVQPPLPPPAPPPAAAPSPQSAPGQPLQPEEIYNPSQAGYLPPGARQANPTEILQALGLMA